MAHKPNRDAAQQTFRQFAWNLAGTLAERQGKSGKGPAGTDGSRRASGRKR